MCMLQVRTKTVGQCVEFYYLSKRLLDKQKKQEEENRNGEMEQQKTVRNTLKRSSCGFSVKIFLCLVKISQLTQGLWYSADVSFRLHFNISLLLLFSCSSCISLFSCCCYPVICHLFP